MFRRALSLFVALCVFAVLLPVSATAHDGETETYTYEVQVQKTRVVPVYETVDEDVYGWVEVPKYKTVEVKVRIPPFFVTVPRFKAVEVKVRIPPFSETYTYYPPCFLLVIFGEAVNYCPPGETKTRSVYNYRTETRYVSDGVDTVPNYSYRTETREVPDGVENVWMKTGTKKVRKQTGTTTETYTDTETKTGTRTVHEQRHSSHCTNTAYANTYPQDCGGGDDTDTDDTDTDDTDTDDTDTGTTCPAGSFQQPLPQDAVFYIDQDDSIIRLEPTQYPVGIYVLYNPTWEALPDNPNCYNAIPANNRRSIAGILVDGVKYAITAGKTVINGVEYVVKNGKLVLEVAENYVLSAAERAAKTAIDAAIEGLKATDRYLHQKLCSFAGAAVTAVVVGSATWAASAPVVGTIVTTATATTAATAAVAAAAATVAIAAYCLLYTPSDTDTDTDDTDTDDDSDTESRAEKEARVAALRAQWMAMLPNAVKDDQKCAGICWDDPANAELLRVYQAWLALMRELYG